MWLRIYLKLQPGRSSALPKPLCVAPFIVDVFGLSFEKLGTLPKYLLSGISFTYSFLADICLKFLLVDVTADLGLFIPNIFFE